MQTLYFQASSDPRDVIEQAKGTKLMAWFKLNRHDNTAHMFTYPEIPANYSWKKNKWHSRARNLHVLSRLVLVHPKDRERFCLRLLLLHVKGATDYADLRSVPWMNNGEPFLSYREAALARGLLTDDNEWQDCLQEAAVYRLGPQLRHLLP